MGVRKKIFIDESERNNYSKQSREWSLEGYWVYDNLPFLKVFDSENLTDNSLTPPKSISLDESELKMLNETTISHTLCTLKGVPLVCVECDDLKEGFNLGSKYHPELPYPRWPKVIYDLKLKVAHGSDFPYFVVGSDCFKALPNDIKLTIVDGIFGEFLAHEASHQRIIKGFNPKELGWERARFEQLSPEQQRDIIHDWAMSQEIDAEFEFSPIHRKSAEVQGEVGFFAHKIELLHYPPINPSLAGEEMSKAMDRVTHTGVRLTLEPPDAEPIKTEVWVPESAGGWFIQEIAMIIACEEYKRRISQN